MTVSLLQDVIDLGAQAGLRARLDEMQAAMQKERETARKRWESLLWHAYTWGQRLSTHGAPHFYEFRQAASRSRKPLDMKMPKFKPSVIAGAIA